MRMFACLTGALPVVAIATIVACTDDEASPSSGTDAAGVTSDAASDATLEDAASSDPATDGSTEAASSNGCDLASKDLASTADANAPVLNAATSNLQRVSSNDTFCTTQKNGAHPTFGAYGYLLNVFLHDDDGDGPTLDELSTAGTVRFGASPAFDVTEKLDLAHGFSTQGEGFSLQLCLDQAFVAGTVTIAVDVADKAAHRSKAICVTEATGG